MCYNGMNYTNLMEAKPMKILVTGATGKLGTKVVETLLKSVRLAIWLSACATRRKRKGLRRVA
ncbi:hypothetical protein HMSSN036_92710 [Paenibacillus macerans]|nr:hypothetical protein HMSSN036_92710 [Paenibacillus macerans]